MKLLSKIRALAAIFIVLFSFTTPMVYSTDVMAFEKPEILDGSKNTMDATKIIKESIDFILSGVMMIGVLAAAISLGMMTPWIGDTEKGKAGFKMSVGVVAGAGLFNIFASWFLDLFF